MKIQIEEDLTTGDLRIRIEADVSRDVVQEQDYPRWYDALASQIAKELDTMMGREP